MMRKITRGCGVGFGCGARAVGACASRREDACARANASR